jgi:hypothetical protein
MDVTDEKKHDIRLAAEFESLRNVETRATNFLFYQSLFAM